MKVKRRHDGNAWANNFTNTRKHATIQVVVVRPNPRPVKREEYSVDRCGPRCFADARKELAYKRVPVFWTHGPTGRCPSDE
jgi:hypothetical protein